VKSGHRERLLAGRWFAALPPPLQQALLDGAIARTLSPGEVLFARGDPPTGLFAIVEGELRVSTFSDEGKEALLVLLQPPTWFGEVSVLDGQPRTHDAAAEGQAVVLQVPQAVLDALFEREPRYWRFLGLLVASKLRLAFVAMEDLALLPLPMRLARRLVLMADSYGELRGATRRRLEVSQDQLASMLSTSRQTVNQLMKDLEARGLVQLQRGAVEIVDLDGLRLLSRP
jgi:CRP-like cAMP-binding protein